MLELISQAVGYPVDQIRYVVLMLLSYPLGYVFRHVLHPSRTSLFIRYVFSLSFGLLFGCLCFGMHMFILFGIIGVCYAMLKYVPVSVVQRYTMVWAMGCMSAAHLYRMMTNYGGWSLDFTGPLMIIVQKVTLVAYALHDGKGRSDSSLNQDQREQKITVCPSLLEYFTYIFNFHSFLAGPSFTIKDYLAFMDGSNLTTKEPSAAFAVGSKFIFSILSVGAFVFLGMHFTKDMTIDPQYSIPTTLFIVVIYGFVFRLKYYYVWYMSDSVNNLCGLGFNGYDEKGKPKWDLISNVDMLKVELPSNIRSVSIYWNSCSSIWLRRVCYERVTISPTYCTMILSAWWHGFYPGYYLSFLFVAMIIEASRKLRRLFRHHFLDSPSLKFGYDIVTMIISRLGLDCLVPPFDHLWIAPSIQFWHNLYYMPMIIPLALILLLPSGKSSRSTNATPQQEKADTKTD